MNETENDIEIRRRSPWPRSVIAAGILIVLILNVIVVSEANLNYDTALDDAATDGNRLVRAMAQQIELTFFDVDITLQRAVEQQYYSALFGSRMNGNLKRSLQAWINESPGIAAMIMLDEHGNPVQSAGKKDYAAWLVHTRRSFAKDAIFTYLSNASDTDYFIGSPSFQGEGVQKLILMGRRITGLDGRFGGVFIAVIDPKMFIQHFNSLDFENHNYLSLQSIDSGDTLVSSSNTPATYAEIIAGSLAAMRKDHPKDVSVTKLTDPAGADEFYAYQQVGSLPLVVTTVMNEASYLRSWREARMNDLELLGIFLALCAMLTAFASAMASQITKGETLEAEAIYASQAKTEFLTNMSHELRTPLNAIIGYSEMIMLGYFGEVDRRIEERMNDIHLCGSHLLQLVTDILEFSKGNAGKLELVEERIFLKDIVAEAVRIMNERIKIKHIETVVEIAATLPPLLGDKRKIRQILFNLLSNSLKFTPEGGTIKVIVNQQENQGQVITVTDTGIGIAEKDIPVALAAFGQAHRDRSHEGTGLGLPLCKMFAELHGGDLILESEQGVGTTVRITLSPARNLADQPAENPSESQPLQP